MDAQEIDLGFDEIAHDERAAVAELDVRIPRLDTLAGDEGPVFAPVELECLARATCCQSSGPGLSVGSDLDGNHRAKWAPSRWISTTRMQGEKPAGPDMPKKIQDKFKVKKAWRPAHIYALIASVRNIKKRNLLRGYSSKQMLFPADAEVLRAENSNFDSQLTGAVLKGPSGLLIGQKVKPKKSSADLFTMTTFPALDWRGEVHYTAGYVNAEIASALDLLAFMETLASIENIDAEVTLDRLLQISKQYGASNFLSYKLAYVRSAKNLTAKSLSLISKIEDEMRHRDSAGLHFSALENLSSKISLFVVAQRRISGLVGKVKGNFRRALTLSNFIPTPLNEQDVAGFLLRATESCLIDAIYALMVIFNLSDELPNVVDELEKSLHKELLAKLESVLKRNADLPNGKLVTPQYDALNPDSDPSLNLYRITSAFLDRREFAKYRHKFDRVIGSRLLSEVIGNQFSFTADYIDKELMLSETGYPLADLSLTSLDAFYRTFLFLQFISSKSNLVSLKKEQVKFLFETTMGLEALLSEDEIRALYITAPSTTKGLVGVLALALFRQKSIDPDVDFEFRTDFISHVNSEYGGSVLAFIEYLLHDSPQVANYIVGSLDEVTLEKLYTLVKNSSQAAKIRCEILRAVGQKLGRIEYFIEADAITTRSKVARLQKYFDSSRMYVDSVSMKKWLDSNPTMSTEQYRSLYPRIEAQISSIENDRGEEADILIIKVNDSDEYLVNEIAKDAFEQFCLNNEFGIESYLGRRIRHNTLDGVTTDTVDAVLRKSEFGVAMSNINMRRTVDAWMAAYKGIVDRLRREHLQFKSSSSLFKSSLDPEDPTTQENIRKLSKTLRSAGGTELLNDLVIGFCWKQIAPQLDNAARFIRVKLLREANDSIDKHFAAFPGASELQMKAELHEAVNEVFKKVADWFQVPQTGFISASVRDLCQIILIDLNEKNPVQFDGDAADVKYTGISVHRLYDCLAVLLQNAHKHGKAEAPITVTVGAIQTHTGSALERVAVSIQSLVSDEMYIQSKQRIFEAIGATETGADMVTEGYTGIKKVKFITRTSEGVHTIRCEADDFSKALKLGFSLHSETALDEIASEDSV